MQNLHITNSDKPVKFYSLDAIISVGYRVKSQRGVQFRIWATNILKEYMKKGFAMEKAEGEYKKYKARTLSDVENDYLNSIRALGDIGAQK